MTHWKWGGQSMSRMLMRQVDVMHKSAFGRRHFPSFLHRDVTFLDDVTHVSQPMRRVHCRRWWHRASSDMRTAHSVSTATSVSFKIGLYTKYAQCMHRNCSPKVQQTGYTLCERKMLDHYVLETVYFTFNIRERNIEIVIV